MRKILASILAITMLLTTLSTCIIPVSAAEIADDYSIYSFDFESEGLEQNVNWVDNTDGTTSKDTRFVNVTGLDLGAVTITKQSGAGDHKVEVVYDPTVETPDENTNKVLALTSAGVNKKTTKVTFNANGNDGYARSTMGVGKKLVYKAKIYLPADFSATESSAFVNPSKAAPTGSTTVSGISATIKTNPAFYVATFGTWNYPQARATTTTTASDPYKSQDRWVEWKHVADVSKPLSSEHSDTVRAFVDDKMVIASIAETGNKLGVYTSSDKYNVDVGTLLIDYPTTASADDLETLGNGGAYSIGDTWWGSHFTINPPADAGEKKYTYYLDDVEAYWIDALTMKAINANEYSGGKVVLEFNQKIREKVEYFNGGVTTGKHDELALKDLFKVVDSTGAEVEGGIAELTTSEDGKKVYIVPSEDLEKGVEYKIEVSPYLIDEYGQGLENNSKATYVTLKISENYVPFTAELSRSEIAGFDSGRDNVKVTANFSVAVDSENIENEIVVTNTDTNEVATGWTYEFGKTENGEDDYKTVIFNFAGLPKANYTVTSTENFAAVNGETLAVAIEITINAAEGAITLFDENFETGYTEGNLLTDDKKNADLSTTTYRTYTIDSPDGKGNWDIQLHSNAKAAETMEVDDFFGIVDAPEGMGTGKVLKVTNSRSGKASTDYIAFRRNFDKERNAYRFDEGDYAGKVLVYEADIYTPSVATDVQIMQPSTNNATIFRHYEGMWKNLTISSGKLRTSSGSYRDTFTTFGHAVSWQRSSTSGNIKDAPGKVKIAIDQSTEMDTMRVYVKGAMNTLSADKVAYLKGHAMNDPEGRYDFGPAIEVTNMIHADQEWNVNTATRSFGTNLVGDSGKGTYGVCSLVAGGTGALAEVEKVYYLDNFKAYLVDAFDIEEVTGYSNNYNTEKGRITFTFSKKVDVETAVENDSIVLLDAEGNPVTGGIESVTAKDGGYQLEVKLSEGLAQEKGYTVWVKAGLRDIDGLSLRTQYSYYLYDIDAHYEKVEGKDNVYLIESVTGDTIEETYTPRVMEGNTVVTPAYLTYYKEDGTTVTAQAATDMYVKDYTKMQSRVNIVTAKSNSLSATAAPVVVENGTVTTKVSFSNPETEAMNVWCIVAAFGEFEEMLGYAEVDVDSIEASTLTDEYEVSFTTVAGGTVKSVKMFVWDSVEDITPYQSVEEIFSNK